MARMLPPTGPAPTQGPSEPRLYRLLKEQLPDEFTVIHSVEWLSAAAREIDSRYTAEGEIDFLILHPRLGMMALEVKSGGPYRFDGRCFISQRSGKIVNPLAQVKRSIHALPRWLHDMGKPTRKMGYALVFPDDVKHGQPYPPSYRLAVDGQVEDVFIDRSDLISLHRRIVTLMTIWQRLLSITPIGQNGVNLWVEALYPVIDPSSPWLAQLQEDAERYLILTSQQQKCLDYIATQTRAVIDGRCGTGKTLLAKVRAQQLAEETKRQVLLVVFNRALATRLKTDLSDSRVRVMTFHEVCLLGASRTNQGVPLEKNSEWYRDTAPKLLHQAVTEKKMPAFGALVIDEAQVLHQDWLRDLAAWFDGKPITACCDVTQVFSYEHATNPEEIASSIQARTPYQLTVNVRSPKAVFDRLEKVFPSHYQQISLREDNDEALSETATIYTESALVETLVHLHDEGIAAKDIALIYTGQQPELSLDEARLVGEIESIQKYRGLEAPVVVVYVDTRVDDATLACAYGRATSRCIVIYNSILLMISPISSFFTKLLLLRVPEIKTRVDDLWNTLGLVQVVSKTACVHWSNTWCAWVVIKEMNPDSVAMFAWRNYLQSTFGSDVVNLSLSDMTGSRSNATGGAFYRIGYCPSCNRIARYEALEGGGLSPCVGCGDEPLGISSGVRKHVVELDSMLANLGAYTSAQKRQLSIYMIALAYWRILSREQQQLLLSHLSDSSGYRDLAFAARILMAVDIVRAAPGEKLTLADFESKYQTWCLRLSHDATDEEWRKTIRVRISTWVTRGWLTRQSKGVYIRRADPPPRKDIPRPAELNYIHHQTQE